MLYYNNNQQIEELKKMNEEKIKELINELKQINLNLSNLNLILVSSDIGRNLKINKSLWV